jgi:hypothetical protein
MLGFLKINDLLDFSPKNITFRSKLNLICFFLNSLKIQQ